MIIVRTILRALGTFYFYHQIMFWGLMCPVLGLPARLFTFWFDHGRRIPHACAQICWGYLNFWTNPFWSVEVEGKEHLQGGGPFLVCCNHQSLIDSLAMLLIGHQVKFISHAKVFTAPILGLYMRVCGYISVDPANPFPAPEVARTIQGWWDQGESVCLYPEGTRSPDGELQPFKVGGFRLARSAQVAVVPVAIDGTHPILPKGGWTFKGSPFHRIRVKILPPITAEQYGDDAILLCRMTHNAIDEALGEMRGRVRDPEARPSLEESVSIETPMPEDLAAELGDEQLGDEDLGEEERRIAHA